MTPNIGTTDRTVRIIAGLAILAIFFLLEGSLRWLAFAGLLPLVTGIVRWCPAYVPFRIRTRKGCCGS